MIRFPVEAAHVLMFARAIGDPNPLFRDAESARAAGYSGVLAPPTFAIASDHFDPAYERRPRAGETWFGSGAAPISATGGSQQPRDGGSGFHAEEAFVYHRPLVVGDVLEGQRRAGKSWQKTGRRGGRLHFSEEVLELCDATNAPALTARWVNVTTERVVGGEDVAAPAPPSTASPSEPAPAAPDWTPCPQITEAAFAAGPLAVAGVREQVLVADLKRTQIVMYAGASGDFHPMHTDASYAQAMGMPGVFAHGMLSMGIAGRALTDLVGAGNLADYRARFEAQVWPGDSLRARTRLAMVGERDGRRAARLELTLLNQHDERVLAGSAHAWLEAQAGGRALE